MAVLISYDLDGENVAAKTLVRQQLIDLNYTDSTFGIRRTRVQMPESTLYNHRRTSVRTVIREFNAIVNQINIGIPEEELKIQVGAFVACSIVSVDGWPL